MRRIDGAAGLWVELLDHGGVRRIGRDADILTLWVGSEAEASPTQILLRIDGGAALLPLLGPSRRGWPGLQTRVQLALADTEPAWFWRLALRNTGSQALTIDAIHVQDLALTSDGALRSNEHYVSHYIDLAPLQHAVHGTLVAARQNQGLDGRHPWALVGSAGRAVSYATDARQLQSLPPQGLPGTRLQHEHALAALQEAPLTLAPGATAQLAWFGRFDPDHADASSDADLARADATLALPAATVIDIADSAVPAAPTLFTAAPWLVAHDLAPRRIDTLFGSERRHAEHDATGALLAFFDDANHHVVLRQKELAVLRPHGHILRTGSHLVPDETALTSTVWMRGVFHSMLCQGHVAINRLLSTVRGQTGQFRGQGLRIFVGIGGSGWQQLGVPSAWKVDPAGCRWVYAHAGGLFSVDTRADGADMTLRVQVLHGAPLKLLLTHHIALAGDDGSGGGSAVWRDDGDGGIAVAVPPGSALAQRFPDGAFAIEPVTGRFDAVHGDAVLHADGASRDEPYICIEAEAAPTFALRIVGRLLDADPAAPAPPLPAPRFACHGAHAATLDRLSTIVPWFTHNALVHHLAPRGLEQYTGGGWGTRDVLQGPLELLLAAGRTAPVRTILEVTFGQQNADGDWPQWFACFDRERTLRADDAHGDIVFWPLLGLARYVVASGDTAFLDAALPDFDGRVTTVWQHVERALALIESRRIPGTRLVAYGHGDWNDALQPADAALRDRLCSAWTVTLHVQTLRALAAALQLAGRDAAALQADAAAIGDDFRRLLVADGVVAGYALFDGPAGAGPTALLVHPSDTRTGLSYSLLPLMHAVLEELLPDAVARRQMQIIDRHLTGPDGARLFDRPMAYHGGPERIFRRAESSAHFGREIALMYMHAHVRWAAMLAHAGRGADLFAALQQLHPVGLSAVVPSAAPRQSNCYHSSSDAAFPDRYAAQDGYDRVAAGTVALEGGWRIYSSGPGIALALLQRHVVGIVVEHDAVVVDPVLPPDMSGFTVRTELLGHAVEITCRVAGPAGCGPTAVAVNGTALPFVRRPNRLRSGAAAVARDAFEAALRLGGNRVAVELA